MKNLYKENEAHILNNIIEEVAEEVFSDGKNYSNVCREFTDFIGGRHLKFEMECNVERWMDTYGICNHATCFDLSVTIRGTAEEGCEEDWYELNESELEELEEAICRRLEC